MEGCRNASWSPMGSWPLEMEGVKIGRSASIGVRAHKQKGTPKLENAGAPPPCGVTPKNTLFPTHVILPNLVVLGQTVRALLMRSA